ncbi:MAG: hypothetical protein N4A65_01150 [Cohaesibacter sp.]|jgi:hypothetical protein|nr:hypothetical protein [Cohaesibacter sp.]
MASKNRIPLSQQIAAINVALSVIADGTKPRKSEREMLSNQLVAAKRSLQWVQTHQDKIRKIQESNDV